MVDMLAVVPGLGYGELRNMPLDELHIVNREVARVSRARAQASKPSGGARSRPTRPWSRR